MSEPLGPNQHVREVDEERNRQDEFKDVGEPHIRSIHTTRAKPNTKNATVTASITRSAITTPPPSRVGPTHKEPVRNRPACLRESSKRGVGGSRRVERPTGCDILCRADRSDEEVASTSSGAGPSRMPARTAAESRSTAAEGRSVIGRLRGGARPRRRLVGYAVGVLGTLALLGALLPV